MVILLRTVSEFAYKDRVTLQASMHAWNNIMVCVNHAGSAYVPYVRNNASVLMVLTC